MRPPSSSAGPEGEAAPGIVIEYWRFFRRETPLLAYGILLTLASSFGQTFFISLFVPSFLHDFGLSAAAFGSLYAAATLGSALLLPVSGRWIDRIPLSRYTAAVLGGLALSAFLLAGAGHVALLALALLGLRLTGQGLSPHAGLTAMARHLPAARGKALSIASLGFPLGEATLPLLVAAGLAAVDWRIGWLAAGSALIMGFLPLSLDALKRSGVELDRTDPAVGRADRQKGEGPRDPSLRPDRPLRWVLRDPTFWLLLPAALLPPFWATGLILYQATLAEMKGWSLTLVASAFVAYAVSRVVFSLAVGSGIDRWSARALFPLGVLPMGAGILFLDLLEGGWVAFLFLGLLGTTIGVSGNLKTALWAELYGTRHLGAIKSFDGGLMVLSTAAAPLVVGAAVDSPASVSVLLWSGAASVTVGTLLALHGVRREPPRTGAEAR